MAEKLLKLEV